MDLDFDLSEAPETNKFVNDLTDILNKINSDNHLCKLRNNDYNKFINEVFSIEEFKPFIDKYFNLFRLLISPIPPDFDVISMFIIYKAKVETGRLTQEEADKYIAEYMNERFIYSKFGGKKNFEKTIIERNKK